MKLDKRNKKIVAREFIVFVIALILTLIAFLWTVFYNYSRNKEIQKRRSQFTLNVREGDSLAKPYKDKLQNQNWFYYKVNQHYDLPKSGYDLEKLWANFQRLADHDSITSRYQTWGTDTKNLFIEIGFDSPEKLKSFIQRNEIKQVDKDNDTKSEHVYNRNYHINNEISNLKESQYSRAEQRQFSLYTFLIVTSILFGLRYFYYAITWSIKTLKDK